MYKKITFSLLFLFYFIDNEIYAQCRRLVDFCDNCTQTIDNLTPNNSTWNFNNPGAVVCITGQVNSNVVINIDNGAKVCFKSSSKFIGNATINVTNNADVIVESGAQANPSADLTINGGQLVNCSGAFNPRIVGTGSMCPCTTLPVELLDFGYKNRKENSVELFWYIAKEEFTSHYEIEKLNAENQWQMAHKIHANHSFQYNTQINIEKSAVLIKLLSVDFDGTKHFLRIIEIADYADIKNHFIYDNNSQTLFIKEIEDDFYIIDALGNKVYNSHNKPIKSELDLSHWSQGVYFIIMGNRSMKFLR